MSDPNEQSKGSFQFGKIVFGLLLFALLGLLSIEKAKIHLGTYIHQHAKLYLSFIVVLIGFIFYGVDRLSRTWKDLNIPWFLIFSFFMTHVWMLFRILTSEYYDLMYPLTTLLGSFAGVLIFIWAYPVVKEYQLSSYSLNVFCAFAFVVAIYGILHTVLTGLPEQGEVSVLHPNHMHVGLYMQLAFGSAIYMFIQSKHHKLKYAYLLLAALFTVLIALSGSRASTLGMLLLIFIWTFLIDSKTVKISMIIVSIAVFLILLNQMESRAALTQTVAVGNNVQVDTSLGFRFFMWYGLVHLILTSSSIFWIGVGYEVLMTRFNEFIYFPVYVNAAHNIFIHVWAELGLIGFVLFFTPYILLLVTLIRSANPKVRFVFAPLLVSLLATGMVQETFYSNESSGHFNTLFFFIYAIALTSAKEKIAD